MEPYPPEDHGAWSGWRCRGHRNPFMAVCLILAGILLFLVNIGILPVHNVWAYWPVFMIVGGIWNLTATMWPGQRIVGLLLIVFGGLFLAGNLGLFHIHTQDNSWLIAALFIVIGVARLSSVGFVSGAGRHRRTMGPNAFAHRLEQDIKRRAGSEQDYMDPSKIFDTAVMGSVQRRIEIDGFDGGVITAVLGSLELDLRRAVAKQSTVTLEATAVLGSIKLRIPENWRLVLRGSPVLGSYEDKTIPQARTDAYAVAFVLTGSSVLGSTEIEN